MSSREIVARQALSTLDKRAARSLTVSYAGDSKMTALHDAAVKQGAMQQLLVWIGFFELFGFVAIVQMLQGGDRQPGDFGFDPLNCAKDPNVSVDPLHSSRPSRCSQSCQARPPLHGGHGVRPTRLRVP